MNRAPRVLVNGVVLGQPMGGVRRHNMELLPRVAKRLTEGGGALSVLTGSEGLPIDLGQHVELLPSEVPPGSPVRRAVLEQKALVAEIERAQAGSRPFDLVHTGHLPVARLPLPYTLTLHDLRSLSLEHTPLSRRLFARSIIGRAVRAARDVVTVSEAVKRQLVETWRLSSDRVHVVPNAADHFSPLPRAPLDPPHILHVGHLEPRKNLERVLEALAYDPKLPDLHLAGAAKGSFADHLAERAQQLSVSDRLHFRGPFADEDLPRLYAQASCVVLPSLLEGFGIPAIEALRAGAPLACSGLPALREVCAAVPSSAAVEFFDPGDTEACAEALRRCLARDSAPWQQGSWDKSAEILFGLWGSGGGG